MPEDIEMTRMEGATDAGQKKEAVPMEDTDYRPVNWKRLLLSWKYLPWHILGIAVTILTIIVAVHHDQVVNKLRPFSEKVRDLPAGFLIPIFILFIISFPPLFGHEIIALLCGIVYGLWIGFGIVAAGTFIGEIGTWFAFKHLFRRKAAKLERTNLNYGALARMTRDGGFWVVLIVRFSAIPSHFSTAVFSTCDVNFWFFFISTFLSLPKQIFLVYLGVLFSKNIKGEGAQAAMFSIIFVVTVAMGIYIWLKLRKIKKVLLEEQADRRKVRMKAEELEMRMEGERMQGQAQGQYSEGSWQGQESKAAANSSPYSVYSIHEDFTPPEMPERPPRPSTSPFPDYNIPEERPSFQAYTMPDRPQYQAYSLPDRPQR